MWQSISLLRLIDVGTTPPFGKSAPAAAEEDRTTNRDSILDATLPIETATKKHKSSNLLQKSIACYFSNAKETREEKVAKLIALDGIPARTVVRSESIRESFTAKGLNLPKSETAVMDLLHDFHDNVAKQEIMSELQSLKEEKFSASQRDEWTSFGNRRYLNINLHTNSKRARSFNLGLVRIIKSCPAEKVKQLFCGRLQEFGLCESDVICCTSDGAPVMVKFGSMLICKHQQCLDHGIHLAVLDVIEDKRANQNTDRCAANQDSDTESDETASFEYDSSDIESESENYNGSVPTRLLPKIKLALEKVRKVVLLFKRSPGKNAVLQEHVKRLHGRELKLKMDCKTRWNSAETMLERFLFLYEPCKSALRELCLDKYLLDEDIALLEDLQQSLQPLKMAVTELSKRDTDLLKCEGSFQ